MDIFKVIELFGAVWLILGIFMLGRGYKWWLFYAFANVPFTIVSIHVGTYWYAGMACLMCLSGIRNYFIGKKKEEFEVKREAMSHLR